jgi:hypothetical protein
MVLNLWPAFGQLTHQECLRKYRLLCDHSKEIDRLAGKGEREKLVAFLEHVRPGIFGWPGAESTASVRRALVDNDLSFPFRLVILKKMPTSGAWTLRHLVEKLPMKKKGGGKDVVCEKQTFSPVEVEVSGTTVLLRAAFEFPKLVVGIVSGSDNIQKNLQLGHRVEKAAEKKAVETLRLQVSTSAEASSDAAALFSSYVHRVLKVRFEEKY